MDKKSYVGREYIKISNSSGKEWILPLKGMKSAMALYQPTSVAGKTVKHLLPVLPGIFQKQIGKKVLIEEYVPEYIYKQLKQCFGNDIELALFLGTPGTHKKVTIQVFRNDRILGYAKYTGDINIISLFENEKNILQGLKKLHFKNAPNCLFMEKLQDGQMIFIQDSSKTINYKVAYKFDDRYRKFLEKLESATGQNIPFEESDFSIMLNELHNYLSERLDKKDELLIKELCEKTKEKYKNSKQKYVYCHRDFTPWNSCVINGELYVFDWEYARKSYPAGMDKIRFLIETKRQIDHKSNDVIYREIFEEDVNNQDVVNYLLDNISIYLERGHEDDLRIVQTNLELLKMVVQSNG